MDTTTNVVVDYPESDGEPMAETELHRDGMIYLIEVLKQRYRGQRVHVTGNLFLYYVEGRPKMSVSPDVFVVLDCEPRRRRVFKTWEEGRTPDVVFELTSSGTKRCDLREKPRIYADLEVAEYFLFDPLGDYLSPNLRGFRLVEGEYVAIEADAEGRLECVTLGLVLRLVDGELRLFDAVTGERLLERWEALEASREAERTAREAAEAEVERLRRLLDERSSGGNGTRAE
jgi:Uma2 family endonuclease